jgi:hypothetical protein
MELPPGFRGYGVKNIVEHPHSALRQAEVDELRAGHVDRYKLQPALMSFKQLLPEALSRQKRASGRTAAMSFEGAPCACRFGAHGAPSHELQLSSSATTRAMPPASRVSCSINWKKRRA